MKISDLPFEFPSAGIKPKAETCTEERSLKELIDEVVHRFPDRTALVGGGHAFTFAELDRFSAAVANFIRSLDHGPETVVAVLCNRGALVPAAALGIMRAGAVYLPVESDVPLARQEIMLAPARVILTDRANIRTAEYFQHKLPGVEQIACLDAADFDRVRDKATELNSTAFWEHVTEAGCDEGWRSLFDGERVADAVLDSLAQNIIEKSGLAQKKNRRVLDIGCGSGMVSKRLIAASTEYTGIDIARNELGRVDTLSEETAVKVHQLEAVDIGFLEDQKYDLINLNGVVESFPGYNYLRKVLALAVDKLADGGVLFIGSVWDINKRDSFRAALKNHAEATGSNSGLIRFDVAAELFLPENFFSAWAAEYDLPLDISVSRPNVACSELSDYRFDVTITKKGSAETLSAKTRFGADDLFALPKSAPPECAPEQAAYIVYTSGSTGRPKGVVVEHRNLLHILKALKPFADGCTRACLVAPLSFDASIQQFAVSLFCGNTLHILSDDERKLPENFYRSVVENQIDLTDMTPAFFNVLVEYLSENRLALPMKKILLAGEVLRPDSVQKFYHIPGNEKVVLYNVYGPTECTVDTSAYPIDIENYNQFSSYPIGQVFDGAFVTIRDKNEKVLPDSVVGEIWISGNGVSRGYLNPPAANAFVEKNGERYYRTGDFGFVEKELVYYVGREDQQVKIRGNRVEIGEVENAIAGCPGVKQVVVVADTFLSGEDKSLAAYVVGPVDLASLKSYLEQLLPPYCVPNYFVPMDELPLNANRKVDKKALPSPHSSTGIAEGRPLRGAVEEQLATVWKKLLGVEVPHADAGFFELGGHSILAVRLIALIEKELGFNLTLSELFVRPTIGGLSELFEGKSVKDNSPVIKLCHCEGGKNLFLFHPVGGSVFCYSELANLLSRTFTVYAVEAAGFSPERTALNTELHRVEDLAAYYLDEILKVESENIIFGGWSFGGLLAYEAACRYEQIQGECGPVLILDSVADNSKAKSVVAKDDVGMLKSLLEELMVFDENHLRSLSREDRLNYLVQCAEECGLLPVGFSSVQMENLLQTYRSNAVAAARYESPTRSDKAILLIRAMEVSESTRHFIHDKYLGWSAFLDEGKISLKWTEGSHETMLSPGLVGNVAKQILEYMNDD